MKKISFLAGLFLIAGTITTSAQVELLPMPTPMAQPATAVYTPNAAPSRTRTAPRGAAPASLVGKKYVSFYGSFSNYGQRCGGMIIQQAGTDSLLLKDFAMGYDVKAKYDAATGKITIPTNVVIGKNNTGADIVLHRLIAANNYANYDDKPVEGTFDGERFSFTDGFYAIAGKSAYVWMDNVNGKEANAMLKTNNLVYATLKPNVDYEYPVYVTKTAANKIEVQGMAQWLYSHNYKVPFTITEASNTALLNTNDSIDWYKTGDEIRSCHMLYRKTDTVNSVSNNPSFAITAEANKTVIQNKNILFEGYKKSGSNSWSGWLLNPFIITVDYNIYTAPVANLSVVDGVHYQVDPEGTTAAVVGCDDGVTDVNIKTTVTFEGKQYDVTEIAKEAFYKKSGVTKLTIPGSIRTIGTMAFSSMTGLNEVHLPDIKTWCNINKVSSSSNMFTSSNVFSKTDTTKWGKVYFDGIAEANPTEITIPEGVTDLRYAFYYYRPLKKVTLASTVKSINYAFYYCNNLTEVKLNEGLETMEYAFYSNSSLTAIDIPHSVKAISQRAFNSCSKLADVKLHTGLKAIEAYAFSSCKGLTKLVLPSTLDTIGSGAFNTCSNITAVECRAMTPPGVYADNIFSAFASKATLSVAESSLAAYKEANGWKNFSQFDTHLGVNNVDIDELLPAVYYNLNGYRVNADRLAPGIYIKVQGTKRTKVLVK